MREYKIYLPLKYNDGKDIEEQKLREIKAALVDAFGAITVSSLTSPYQGRWKYGGVEYIMTSSRSRSSQRMTELRNGFSRISKSVSKNLFSRLTSWSQRTEFRLFELLEYPEPAASNACVHAS